MGSTLLANERGPNNYDFVFVVFIV